jgi:CheY-like chemotaxis protein
MQSKKSQISVLVVEDDVMVRQTVSMLLSENGYRVTAANNGFDALLRLQEEVPDVLVTDLNMPEMSGFELLSVVRRRFPSVVAVATSAAYSSASVPPGVIADAFYAKGKVSSGTLLEIITSAVKKGPIGHDEKTAPVWIPRNGRDHNGKPFVVLTCTECLRSFPFTVNHEPSAEVLTTPCIYCPHEVSYIIDFSRSLTSPQKRVEWRAKFLQDQASATLISEKKKPESAGAKIAEVTMEMAKPVKAKSARPNDKYN